MPRTSDTRPDAIAGDEFPLSSADADRDIQVLISEDLDYAHTLVTKFEKAYAWDPSKPPSFHLQKARARPHHRRPLPELP